MWRKQPSSSPSFWHSSSRRSRSASAPAATPRGAATADPPLGCMSMVHHLIFAPGAGCVGRPPPASSASDDCRRRCDVEDEDKDQNNGSRGGGFQAPRNSLDLDADNLNDVHQIVGVQIQPVFDALATTAPSPLASEAETPRTPSLVARLMGIDGLPDSSSSNHSPALKQQQQLNKKPTTARARQKEKEPETKKRVIPESMNRDPPPPLRSLLSCNVVSQQQQPADTPRASTSARASWDGARMSLQALKEHVLDRAAQYMSLPSSPTSSSSSVSGKKRNKNKKDATTGRRRVRRDSVDEEERERTAKEIVRQAKETVTSRKQRQQQQISSAATDNKENVSPVPVRKDKLLAVVVHQAAAPKLTEKPSVLPPPPPPKRALKPLAPRVALAPKNPHPNPPSQRTKPSPPPPPLDTPPTRARKPDGCERFATRTVKKPAPLLPAAAPASSSPCSRHAAAAATAPPEEVAVPLEEDPEYGYLRTVLERGGFMRPSSPASRRTTRPNVAWAPVDPIVFHLLELEVLADYDEARLGPLRHRWNRKLMFHLAQEILADILLVPAGIAASATSVLSGGGKRSTITTTTAEVLLSRVWKRVRSFPAADCRVVGDIDALVATDLLESSPKSGVGWRHPAAVAEEANEVAERVLESLIQECVGVAEEESPSLSSCYCSGTTGEPLGSDVTGSISTESHREEESREQLDLVRATVVDSNLGMHARPAARPQ